MISALGAVTVPTPGTPVRATINRADPSKPIPCHGIMFEALPANTGFVYIGQQNMNRSTLEGVYAVIPVPSTNILPSFSTALTLAPNGLGAHLFWVDADNPTDGVLVTFLQL